MQAIKQKIKSNKAFINFIAYCLTFVGYGCVILSLGPVVPYFSAVTGTDQTAYSFLFFWRSLGFIFGSFFIRLFEQRWTFHTILILSSTILLILLTITCFVLNVVFLGIMMLLIGCFCCILQISINICLLETIKNGDIEFWMFMLHGMFGVGGLVGPIYVYVFEINSFAAIGLSFGLVAPFYWYLNSPQDHKKIEKQIKTDDLIEQARNVAHQGQYQTAQNKQQQISTKDKAIILKPLLDSIGYLICFSFFISVGLQSSYAAWIPSYTVLQNIATKQQSTMYSSLYWIIMTVFRFIFSCSKMKTMQKLFTLSQMMLGSYAFIVLMIWMDYRQIACIVGTVLLGICYSGIFPLLFSVSQQYDFEPSTTQTTNFITCVSLGQGCLATLVGYCMGWFTNDILYFMTSLMAAILLISIYFIYVMFEKEKKQENVQRHEIENQDSEDEDENIV